MAQQQAPAITTMLINGEKVFWLGVLKDTLFCLKAAYRAYEETKDQKYMDMARSFQETIMSIKEKVKTYG